MVDGSIAHETTLRVADKTYNVQIFSCDNGKYFAFTRFSDRDAIIIDGASVQEALEKHVLCLPLAVGCRRAKSNHREP